MVVLLLVLRMLRRGRLSPHRRWGAHSHPHPHPHWRVMLLLQHVRRRQRHVGRRRPELLLGWRNPMVPCLWWLGHCMRRRRRRRHGSEGYCLRGWDGPHHRNWGSPTTIHEWLWRRWSLSNTTKCWRAACKESMRPASLCSRVACCQNPLCNIFI